MNKEQHEKQLELPNIETGFYEFISKEIISFPKIDLSILKSSNKDKLDHFQTRFCFKR